MALILPRSAMIHVPKTGGSWCHQALFDQGILLGVLHSPANDPHPFPATVRAAIGDDGRFLFAFVRQPLAWLESYWASAYMAGGLGVERHRMSASPWHEIAACEGPTFLGFITAYLQRCPGEVSRLYAHYTSGVTFVGRQERLLEDLEVALGRAGESVDYPRLRATPRINQQAALLPRRLLALPAELITAVREAERTAIAAFYQEHI